MFVFSNALFEKFINGHFLDNQSLFKVIDKRLPSGLQDAYQGDNNALESDLEDVYQVINNATLQGTYQAVGKQLPSGLQDACKDDNKEKDKKISMNAVDSELILLKDLVKTLQDTLETLKTQLENKDSQIKDLSNQIKKLNEHLSFSNNLIDQSHRLNAADKMKLLAEDNKSETDVPDKKWYQFWK